MACLLSIVHMSCQMAVSMLTRRSRSRRMIRTMCEDDFREPTSGEQAMLMKLLERPFPGRDALLTQVPRCRVRTLHQDGTFEIYVAGGLEAGNVNQRVPVEVRDADDDGVPVDILLHVVNGRLAELEIVKLDGSPIRKTLDPNKWQPVVRSP
ncbi:DUF6984 family protein [Fontivita pretiosa]|uniref:DUF6984 family protein n=1 Tax=Fontivita pretiosa TaxID=2989684 RepID=UPI003D176095